MKISKSVLDKIATYPDAEDFEKELLKDPKVRAEYDKLEPQFSLIRQVLDARIKHKMTQKDLAIKMKTSQSDIARFEGGDTNPTLSFIQRLAHAIKTPITISVSG